MGGQRTVPSLASSLGLVRLGRGRHPDGTRRGEYGIRWTVAFGAVMIAIGLYISTLGEPWQLWLGHGLFMGLLGNAGLNAPLYVYVSRWFDKRRGSALALISSGGYLAGFVWPTVFERSISSYGWKATMIGYGIFQVAAIVPVAMIFLKPPPEISVATAANASGEKPTVLGWPPNVTFALIAFASFLCCVTMSMPQAHIVALCSDLGISASVGAAMLSVLLGAGLLSRQF